ncbi:MAG: vWA domain-containing protein [bacterium]
MASTQVFNDKEKRSITERATLLLRGSEERSSVEKTANDLLLDISGSMGDPVGRGDQRSKTDGVKEAVTMFVSRMSPTAWLSIILFNGSARLLWPMQPLEDKGKVINEVQKIIADGSTNMAEGMMMALEQFKKAPKEFTKRLFVLSDGISGSNPMHAADLLKKAGARITSIGFGDDLGALDTTVLKAVASTSPSGNPEYYHFLDSANLTCFMENKTRVI